jgi:hypothetical protein
MWKRRFNSGKDCYHVILNSPSSLPLFKDVKFKIYNIIILAIDFYECETRSLTLREKHRSRVFENGVLRTTLGPKRVEVAGGLRKLHNEELHNLYCSPDIFWMFKPRNEIRRAYSNCRKG